MKVLSLTFNAFGQNLPLSQKVLQQVVLDGDVDTIVISIQEFRSSWSSFLVPFNPILKDNQSVKSSPWLTVVQYVFNQYIRMENVVYQLLHVQSLGVIKWLLTPVACAQHEFSETVSDWKISLSRSISSLDKTGRQWTVREVQCGLSNIVTFFLQPASLSSVDFRVRQRLFRPYGFWNVFGNKGAQFTLLEINQVQFLVVNAHLCAHAGAHNFRTRQQQLRDILETVEMIQSTQPCNAVVVMGDFNFRLQLTSQEFKDLTRQDIDLASLLAFDELTCMLDGNGLGEMYEQKIDFAPSYKVHTIGQKELGTLSNVSMNTKFSQILHLYQTEKRTPAWCDRILFNIGSNTLAQQQVLQYKSISSLGQSDHNPVYAVLEVTKGLIPSRAILENVIEQSDQSLVSLYPILLMSIAPRFVVLLSVLYLSRWINWYRN
ncbi:hypothetical protein MIR68_000393 [Amoeboaphelidium protococcarum]|nr:hypothetical protein MIR68_000393 [Amoeboaphelidium protococcarum]